MRRSRRDADRKLALKRGLGIATSQEGTTGMTGSFNSPAQKDLRFKGRFIQAWGVLAIVVMASACGSNDQSDLQGGVSPADDSGIEVVPHDHEQFYIENWPGSPWDLMSESVEDFEPNIPHQDIDPALLSQLPRTMASMGDSMSRAAVANYKRWHIALPWVWAKLAYGGLWAALTDSKEKLEFPGLSWTTGLGVEVLKVGPKGLKEKTRIKKVASHALRIQEMLGRESLEIYSGAMSGAESEDIYRDQADRVLNYARHHWNQGAPDYVTLLIGGNDACASTPRDMTPVNEYHDNVSYAIDKILRANSKTRVLVASVPDIEGLRTFAKDATVVGVGGARLSCLDIWKLVDQCATLTTENHPTIRRLVKERVDEYNLSLQSIVKSRASVFGDRVRYGNVFDMSYNPDDLSFDCFHPNISGHNKLADRSWKATWWAKP